MNRREFAAAVGPAGAGSTTRAAAAGRAAEIALERARPAAVGVSSSGRRHVGCDLGDRPPDEQVHVTRSVPHAPARPHWEESS